MAKLATLAALLAALLVMSHAVAAHRAVMTSVEVDEEADNPHSKGCSGRSCSCREQVQSQGRGLYHCEQLFENMVEQSGSGRGFGGGTSCYQWTTCPHFRPCCQELRRLDNQCRCEGIRQLVRQQQGQYKGQGLEEDVVTCARKLPSLCGMSPQQCHMSAIWY